MFDNTIFFKNINNYKFNFKKILKPNNTIILFNCKNIDLYIKSKINRIILQGCNNINLKVSDMISGIEVLKSKDIIINISKNKNINSLELFNSNIKINKLNYRLINENSFIKL